MIIAAPVLQGKVAVTVDAALNEQNRMVGDVRVMLEDDAVEAMYHALEGKRAAGRIRYFEQALRATISDARLVDLDAGSLKNAQDGSSHVTFSFYSDHAVSVGEQGVAVLRMPSLAPWFRPVEEGNERGEPSVGGARSSFEETVRLDLDRSGFRVHTLPELKSVETAAGRLKQSLSLEKDHILLARTVLERDSDSDTATMEDEARLITVREHNDRQRIILQREEMPDEAHLVVFDEQVRITLLEPGYWQEERIREWGIMAPDGLHDRSLLRFAYDPRSVEVRIESVAVRSPEGVISMLDPDAVSRTVEGTSPAENIVMMNLSDLEVGSTVRTHVVLTHRGRPFFSAAEGFSGPYPIRRKRVEVRYPEGHTLAHEMSGEGRVLQTRWEEEGHTVIEWSARNLPALARESDCPPDWMISPVLFLSQGDAESVVDWIARSVLRAASGTRAMRRVAREKSEGANHRTGQIIALRDWVDREIEPVDPGLCGLSPGEIRRAEQILEERSGTRAERMILLYALLDAMRLSPRMVLASDLPRGISLSAPPVQALQWDALSHLLVAIEGEGGETIYLDETGSYAPLGYTAHAGRPAIDLQTGEWIYPRTLLSDQTDTVYQIRLQENGDADVELVVRHFGSAAVRFHRRFEAMTQEEHRQEQQRMIREIGLAPEGEAELHVDLEGATIEVTMHAPEYAIREGDWMVVTLPALPSKFFPLSDLPREHPVYIEDAEVHAVIAELHVPAGWRPVVLPSAFEMVLPGRTAQIFVQSGWQAGQVRCAVELHRLPGVIAPGEYARIMYEVDRLLRTPARTVLLYREGG